MGAQGGGGLRSGARRIRRPRCCESAAEPPLPQTMSLRPASMASAVSLPRLHDGFMDGLGR